MAKKEADDGRDVRVLAGTGGFVVAIASVLSLLVAAHAPVAGPPHAPVLASPREAPARRPIAARVPAATVPCEQETSDDFLQRAWIEARALADECDYRGALARINRFLQSAAPARAATLDRLDPLVEECERHLAAQDHLVEAESAMAQERFAAAEAALAEMPPGAPVAMRSRAEVLRREMPTRRAVAAARASYRAGRGSEALAALAEFAAADAVELRVRIAQVMELSEAARAAAAAGWVNEAILHWVGVLEREPDERNAYRAAAAGEPVVRERCLAPAEAEYRAGIDCLRAVRWNVARTHLDRALELFPHHGPTVRAIDEFCAGAERDFNSDMANFHKGQLGLELILARFEGVLAFLEPQDGNVYDSYRGVYERFRARERK